MAIDQVSEMSPRAAMRATPIDPMIKADAHRASPRTLRFCSQESSSKKPATAQTNTATTKSVGISSDMDAPAERSKRMAGTSPAILSRLARSLSLRAAGQILAADRQGAQPLAGGGEDRVGDRGLDHGRAGLADAAPSLAGGGRDVDFRLRCVLVAGDRVGVEVALLDAAVLHGDLAEQRRREAVDHAAFELRLDAARVHDDAAVADDDDAFDLDLAASHRDLGGHADDRVVALVDGDAAAFAARHRLAPVALLDQEIDDLLEVRAMGEELAPQRHRVLAGRVRHLVDEALHEEHVLGMPRRAPWPERHVRVLKDRDDAEVRQAVARVDEAL